MLGPTTRVKLSSELRLSMHSEGAVLLDVDGGRVFSTNRIGAVILAGLESKTLGEIAAEVSREFSVPLERVQGDVTNFVEDLGRRKLVSRPA
jgi:Coenzyme PQQ synthesis protein D (PqqD)